MKKVFTLAIISIVFAIPTFADEINLTPHYTFSGTYNKSVRPAYPQLKKSLSASDIVEEEEMDEMMGPKSVKEMGSVTPQTNKQAPMTYGQFPQYMDSSNSMMMMQGGMQNMFMGY